ncbi:hypothetical protein GCM10009539_04920 [Cryptosporangium japonicum]|uniref:Uncharacterized protein n=1 Tax=Cryptosporangium japonicum TaxID=80872 RepID=A0ABP3D3V5_9ACTN
MAKEMEGDNRKRRALAREARAEDRSPSESGVTLGSSKQREHTRTGRRDGPPPAGAHKPGAHAPVTHRPHDDTETSVAAARRLLTRARPASRPGGVRRGPGVRAVLVGARDQILDQVAA